MLSRNIKLNALVVLAALVFALAMVPLRTAQWGKAGNPAGVPDSDAWLRLIRAEQTQKTDSRSSRIITGIAPPAGLDLHWTAPVDTLLIFGSKLLYPKSELKSALFKWSLWYPALLFALAVLCIVIIINLLGLPPVSAVFALAVMALNPFMLGLFSPGNVDHHNLQAVLWLTLAAFVLSGIKTGGRSAFVLGGLTAGLGVWVSTQFLLPAALACAAIIFWWLGSDEKFRWRLALFAASAALGTAAAVAVEYPPQECITAVYDMVSVAHVALFLFGFCAAVLGGVFLPRIKTLRTRIIFVGSLAACAAIALYLFFPGFYAEPIAVYGGGDFFAMMGECRPMSALPLEIQLAFWLGFIPTLETAFYYLTVSSSAAWRMWLFIATASAAAGFLTLYEFRWYPYCIPLFAVALGAFGVRIGDSLRGVLGGRCFGFVSGGLVSAALVAVPPLAVIAAVHRPAADKSAQCSKTLIAKIQNGDMSKALPGASSRVLVQADMATQLVYWTPHHAVFANYHRAASARKVYESIFNAPDSGAACETLHAAQIDAVLFCAGCKLLPRQQRFADALERGELTPCLAPVTGFDRSGGIMFFTVRPQER